VIIKIVWGSITVFSGKMPKRSAAKPKMADDNNNKDKCVVCSDDTWAVAGIQCSKCKF
jgi:hypothetical protein